ncbi:MAG TPA: phosphoribosylglycinamide formyltransferase [Longimicrobiaceae bacterium]|nr:phosphoribosylglycinamide formyltransferase [Longimicrobiaceae bacterium]
MAHPARVAVFVSGGGTNLQALIDRFHAGAAVPARVALVVAGRAGIGALERAARAGIDAVVVPEGGADDAGWLLGVLERHAIDLVVLAGYLRLVPHAVVHRYRGRMLNIHPALLPAFGGPGMYGMRVHRAVLASGACVSGATVHLVDEEYDSGRIVAQWPVPVLPGDTPESLAVRVLAVEHRLLPLAVEAAARAVQPSDGPMPDAPAAFELVRAAAPAEGSIRALLNRIPSPES